MIEFFNVKTGERRQVNTEPLIAGYYNSTNQHVNATRGQDFGWRIAPATIKRIREIRGSDMEMTKLASTFQIPLDEVKDTDILHWISLEDNRANEQKQDQSADFTRQYEQELRELDGDKMVKHTFVGETKKEKS